MAANDDQSQMLRRAMQAATAAEDAREGEAPEGVQIFEPISVDEADDSAAAQAAVFAPAKPAPVAANDAVTHDAIDEPALEESVAPPIRLADWIEVEIDENAAAEADLPLEVFEAPVFDAPVEAVANDVELLPIETEPVIEEPAVEKPLKKRAPAKRKAPAKPRKAKIADDATAGPGEGCENNLR